MHINLKKTMKMAVMGLALTVGILGGASKVYAGVDYLAWDRFRANP